MDKQIKRGDERNWWCIVCREDLELMAFPSQNAILEFVEKNGSCEIDFVTVSEEHNELLESVFRSRIGCTETAAVGLPIEPYRKQVGIWE